MPHLIFLDIDGVICCNMAGRLEESKLEVLNEIVKATAAKVVLSTDWRQQAVLKRQVIAAQKRFDIETIGATPMRAMFQPIRPEEITEWIAANGAAAGMEGWVAIDDRDLVNERGGRELVGHFVHTHPNTGLTKRLADAAIAILKAGSAGASADGQPSLKLVSPAPSTPTPGQASLLAARDPKPGFAATAPARMRTQAARGSSPIPAGRKPGMSAVGGAAAAPSTLQAVRNAQGRGVGAAAGGRGAVGSPGAARGRGVLSPATRAVSPFAAAAARGGSPPRRWSGASPCALAAGGTEASAPSAPIGR